jgi:acyl-CoA thioesterase
MSDLEQALTLTPLGRGSWLATADSRYEAKNGLFGGWTAAISLRAAILASDDFRTPSSMSINIVNRINPDTEILVKPRKFGGSRSLEHWEVELTDANDGNALAIALVLLTRRRKSDGHTEPSMPEADDPETYGTFNPPGNYGQRTLRRPVAGFPPANQKTTESVDWVRDMTGRLVDYVQLAFLADSYAPRPNFWGELSRRTSTISMSVFFHATPEEVNAIGDDYIMNEAVGTRGIDLTSGQRARLWSRQGVLLVTTEQIQWFREI